MMFDMNSNEDFLLDEKLKLEVNLILISNLISNTINGLFDLKAIVEINEVQSDITLIHINLANSNSIRRLMSIDLTKTLSSIHIKIIRSEMSRMILLMDGYTKDKNLDIGYLNKVVDYFMSYDLFEKVAGEYRYDIYNICNIRTINSKLSDNVSLFADADPNTIGLLVNNI